MFAWMTLLGRSNPARTAPPKKRTFTQEFVHGHGCVHRLENGLQCGKVVPHDKPNGWLCWEHDRENFPIHQAVH